MTKIPGYPQHVPNEFQVLRDRLRQFAAARGWGKSHTPRSLALALVGEVGELSAELQWVPDEMMSDHLSDPIAKARIADEAADVLIYLLQFADKCDIDLFKASSDKIARNGQKYPATCQPTRRNPSDHQNATRS